MFTCVGCGSCSSLSVATILFRQCAASVIDSHSRRAMAVGKPVRG